MESGFAYLQIDSKQHIGNVPIKQIHVFGLLSL